MTEKHFGDTDLGNGLGCATIILAVSILIYVLSK